MLDDPSPQPWLRAPLRRERELFGALRGFGAESFPVVLTEVKGSDAFESGTVGPLSLKGEG